MSFKIYGVKIKEMKEADLGKVQLKYLQHMASLHAWFDPWHLEVAQTHVPQVTGSDYSVSSVAPNPEKHKTQTS